jgi:hypothetical protein
MIEIVFVAGAERGQISILTGKKEKDPLTPSDEWSDGLLASFRT